MLVDFFAYPAGECDGKTNGINEYFFNFVVHGFSQRLLLILE